jgi:hypothetical protein
MDTKLKELYDKLDSIFQKYTTHNWKNGWQNEGDRESKELTVQNRITNHNEFLLYNSTENIHLQSNNFKLELRSSENFFTRSSGQAILVHNGYRVDITFKDKHIYYYIDDENWYLNSEYILELCECMYETVVRQRETIDLPDILGDMNPIFLKNYLCNIRDKKLEEIFNFT